MLTLGSSMNYISLEGLPWVVLAWIGLICFRPFATFFHELGHLFFALIFTKQEVFLRVGDSINSWHGNLSRISWEITLRKSSEGFTGYEKESLSKVQLILVIAGGPLASFIITLISGWIIFNYNLTTLNEVILVSWFSANALVLVRSSVPLRLKPTTMFPEGPPSDGLELKKILFKKKRGKLG